MKVYLVGGAVRDKLLHRTVKEKDFVVVGATPEEMIALGYKPVGKDFPVFLHPDTKEEYALARTERKTGHGYKGFQCYAAPDVTLEQDLLRRDLTINALAEDENGNVLDYYCGREDLKKKVLRHVSPAFSEDPLRVLRVARFAARYYPLGFTIHSSTLQLMKDMVNSGEVNYLVPDRVWKELEKVLEEENPSVFFKVLEQCGALSILFPTLAHLSSEHYAKSLENVDRAAKQNTTVDIRYALLCYSLPIEENNKLSLNKAGYPVPKDFSALAILLNQYHHKAASLKSASHEEILLLLENIDAFRREERFLKFLMACEIIQGKSFSKELLLKVFDTAKAVPIKPLLAQGLVGPDIAKALHEKRLEAIKAQYRENI